MLAKQKTQLAELILLALQKLSDELGKPSAEFDRAAIELSLEKPRQAGHGDLACNIALRLAKPLGIVPREFATQLSARLSQAPAGAALIEKIEVAGPGFLNFTLTCQARAEVLFSIAVHPERFGYSDENSATGEALIEFVSANPTGPLHVGHGRQAALGDTLASLLSAVGIRVKREFYYNDAGAQIQNLALSVQARAKGLSPEDPAFPADGYKGDYIADIAQAYVQKATVQAFDGAPAVSTGDLEDLEAIRRFAVAYLRHEQDLDLRAFGVDFDRYYLESSLYADGKVQAAVDALVSSGHAYESEGALWLRTTIFGDDKDRVMRKSDGSFTYFVPDVAYHVTKWQRGFSKAINIQGSDHHGTVARVRAGLQALNMGIPAGYPDYVLHKMVTVMRSGQEVKISKRAGSYVTLRDLISWSGEIKNEEGQVVACDEIRGRDAVRFFLVSRKADTEFVFDVDLALSKSEDNPVYYVQYAHARICSVLLQAGVSSDTCLAAAVQGQDRALAERLDAPKERLLLNRLAEFPGVVQACADELSPHLMAFYLRELAGDFHSFYNSERVLVDEPELRQARLLLLAASGAVLRSGLSLLGVSAPTQM